MIIIVTFNQLSHNLRTSFLKYDDDNHDLDAVSTTKTIQNLSMFAASAKIFPGTAISYIIEIYLTTDIDLFSYIYICRCMCIFIYMCVFYMHSCNLTSSELDTTYLILQL